MGPLLLAFLSLEIFHDPHFNVKTAAPCSAHAQLFLVEGKGPLIRKPHTGTPLVLSGSAFIGPNGQERADVQLRRARKQTDGQHLLELKMARKFL